MQPRGPAPRGPHAIDLDKAPDEAIHGLLTLATLQAWRPVAGGLSGFRLAAQASHDRAERAVRGGWGTEAVRDPLRLQSRALGLGEFLGTVTPRGPLTLPEPWRLCRHLGGLLDQLEGQGDAEEAAASLAGLIARVGQGHLLAASYMLRSMRPAARPAFLDALIREHGRIPCHLIDELAELLDAPSREKLARFFVEQPLDEAIHEVPRVLAALPPEEARRALLAIVEHHDRRGERRPDLAPPLRALLPELPEPPRAPPLELRPAELLRLLSALARFEGLPAEGRFDRAIDEAFSGRRPPVISADWLDDLGRLGLVGVAARWVLARAEPARALDALSLFWGRLSPAERAAHRPLIEATAPLCQNRWTIEFLADELGDSTAQQLWRREVMFEGGGGWWMPSRLLRRAGGAAALVAWVEGLSGALDVIGLPAAST